LSLIEAMIALAIAAIIAGYAVPTYRQHLVRAHRLNAALAVRQAAQYIEGRQLFDHAGGAMRDSGSRGQGSHGDPWLRLPAHLARAPADGPVVYRLHVDAGQAPGPSLGGAEAKAVLISDMSSAAKSPETTSYWIVAVPVESGPMAGDACGSFILDGSGRRSNTGTASAEQCWSGA
jgi:type IV pilus assembly protein PilE